LSGEGAFLFNLKKCFDAEFSRKKYSDLKLHIGWLDPRHIEELI
jgi:hypothetical protein